MNLPTEIDSNILLPGTVLQEFEIERCIGSGGFGITYLAKDVSLNRAVAIKEYFPFDLAYRQNSQIVSPRTQTQSDLDDFSWGLERVIQEARTLAQFEHPNIVRVIRYIESNGTAYIVMEYVPGRELADIIQEQGTLSATETRAYILPLLEGLEVVHQAEMLHRDIKPGNIIIREGGSPTLIDFGAARQAVGGRSKSLSAIVTHGYAPIEQYSPKGEQGPWTDIYALAAVGHACLTSQPPEDATERTIEDRTPKLIDVASDQSDPDLLSALDWALSPSRHDRPQSVAELRERLSGSATPSIYPSTAQINPDNVATQRISEIYSEPSPNNESKFPLLALIAGAVSILAISGFVFSQLLVQQNKVVEVGPEKPVVKEVISVDQQTPEGSSSNTNASSAPAPRQATVDPRDIDTFNIARKIGTSEAYQIYLIKYPNGAHADEVKQLLTRIGR